MKIKPSLTNTQAKSIYEKFLGQNFKTIPIIAKLRLNALLLIATQRIETQEFGLNLYDIANILSYASNGEIPFYLAVIQQSLSQRDFGLLLEVFIEHEIANSQQSTFGTFFFLAKCLAHYFP
ncbi:MAG: hypothetical protein HWD59_01095 [Coxiellaceae bacterium]|nr:MAG: hypothetical protein HWD59_01095 [Coxiellaceae bacterium]